MAETKQLHALSNIYLEAVYGGAKKEAPKDNRLVVTAADKKANTKAYQNYKAGNKAYKAADHLKTEDAKYGYDKDGKSLNPKDKKKVSVGPRLGEPRTKGSTAANAGQGEKIQKRTKAWMDKKGQKGAPGLDAMKARDAEHKARRGVKREEYDNLDNELLEIVENTLGNFPEDEILDMMESMYHRRNPGKKHPLESGSSKVTPRPVSDKEKKSTDKEDRMYVAMRRVKDRQKGYSKDKSDAADRLHGHYTSRQSARKKGASPKEAAAGSHGDFGSKGFRIKRGGRSGEAPRTDRGTGNKAARRAGQEVKDRDPRKTRKEENFFSRFRNI